MVLLSRGQGTVICNFDDGRFVCVHRIPGTPLTQNHLVPRSGIFFCSMETGKCTRPRIGREGGESTDSAGGDQSLLHSANISRRRSLYAGIPIF